MRKALSSSSGRIRFCTVLILASCGLPSLWLWADAPAWWTERGVLNPAATADDYAVVNQGQVKNIAKQAYEEMKANGLIDPVATPTAPLVQAWETPAAGTDDYLAINLGQLKNIAQPFYDRLIAEGLATAYPWSASGTAADDYALANIGQVKNLFSFVIPGAPVNPNDTDGNGLPDAWEMEHFGHIGINPNADSDGDGVSNLDEFNAGTDPLSPDNTTGTHMILFAPFSR